MIVCCGEALVDMLPRTSTEGEATFAPYAGGAIFNTAIALGRLGISTELFSGISTDMFASTLTDMMEQSHVSYSMSAVSDQPTTLAFVTLNNGQAKYAFFNENSALSRLTSDDLPSFTGSEIQAVDALYFGGISLIPNGCGSAFEAMMEREHKQRLIMIDPNIRPSFINDKEAYGQRIQRMMAMSDIVKVSDEDLEWFGLSNDPMEAAASLLDNGPSIIILTRGSEGVTAFSKTVGEVSAEAPKVTVADTVGAGDTFNAGFLASLSEQGVLNKSAVSELSADALRTALELGVKVAAITVSRQGANPPWKHEL